MSDPRPLRPGERRLKDGSITIFDFALLNAHVADERLAAMPSDLSTVSYAELCDLNAKWLNRQHRLPHDADTLRWGKLICDERAKRPEHARAYGSPKAEAA